MVRRLETLYAIGLLLEIPEQSFLSTNYGKAYPVWLIQEKLETQGSSLYASISHLIWTLQNLDNSNCFS
ncbi:MAG: hypothetical protein H0X26_08815 [Alphaproteobacteria bacterium]|nr:hypothetical protein [Alphaproteobacteria bacterium]